MKNALIKQNVLHSLSLVDLVVYHKDRKGLHHAAEIYRNPVLQNIPGNVLKTSIILFLNEVLCNAMKEEEPNQQLFDFLFHRVQILDMQSPVNSNFHLYFLIQLSRYLGFYPTENYSETNSIFNLQDGMFQSSIPIHPFYIENSLSPLFNELIKLSLNFSSDIKIHTNERRLLIEKILQYYSLHIAGFGETKSHKVLEEILS